MLNKLSIPEKYMPTNNTAIVVIKLIANINVFLVKSKIEQENAKENKTIYRI
jgi:hypothetical protein